MVRKLMCLTNNQVEKFTQKAEEHGITFSEMIRRALDEYLKQEQNEKRND